MKFLIVKVKDKDLYFNADEMEGAYVCDTPMLMNKEQADSIMEYADELCNYDNYDANEVFTKDQLEVREVELNII
jgi:hypothetical protein